MDLTLERLGRLDILVNSAGVGASGSLEDMPESVLHKVLDANFFGPLELMRLVLPVMRKQRAGRISNLTSVASLFSTPEEMLLIGRDPFNFCTSPARSSTSSSTGSPSSRGWGSGAEGNLESPATA